MGLRRGAILITVNLGIAPTVAALSSEVSAAAQRGGGPRPAGRTVCEAPLPGDPALSVRAPLADGRAVSTASKAVRTGWQCTGEAVFMEYGAPAAAQPRPVGRPDAAPPGEPQPAPPDPSGEAQDGEKAPPAERDDAAVPEAAQPDGDEEGGCLIATAAHGTELAPQVQRLREARDGAPLTTESSRAFMSAFSGAYYFRRRSPTWSAAIPHSARPWQRWPPRCCTRSRSWGPPSRARRARW